MPLTFFLSNDGFYFGVLPILPKPPRTTASPASRWPGPRSSASRSTSPPAGAAMLLLISLAKVDLADHHKKVIWRSVVLSLVMLVAAVATGSSPSAEDTRTPRP